MSDKNNDADFHAGPLNERIVRAPWHTALHFDGARTGSIAREMMVVIPDYDTMDTEQDGYFVRVDTLQVDENGEASATSILWDVREMARFCNETMALLAADRATELAYRAEQAEAEDEDLEDEDLEDEDDLDGDEGEDDEDPEDDDMVDYHSDDEDPEDDDEGEDDDDSEDEDPEDEDPEDDPEDE